MDRYDEAKAFEFYKKVIALDPDGKKGATDYDTGRPNGTEKVTYTQYAEFNIGTAALSARPPDPALLQAFIKKYPKGGIVNEAFSQLSRAYFLRTGTKDEASKFYTDYVGRFPRDVQALSAWVQRILSDKEPVDKGIDLANKALELIRSDAKPDSTQAVSLRDASIVALNLARLFNLKGDKAKAVETVDAASKEAGDTAQIIPSIAQAYIDLGAEDKALAVYGPAFYKKNIGAPVVLRGYATFWTNQNKNLDGALEAAKKGTELAADDYRSWTTLGNVHLKLKNAAEAIKAADKAIQVAPAGFQEVAKRLADQIKNQAAAIK